MLYEKLTKDLQGAMKAKDQIRVSTLRLLIAAMHNAAIAKRTKMLNDNEMIDEILKQIKQRNESIELFKKGRRDDLVAKEEKELEILKSYLPQQLNEEELLKIIKEAIAEVGAQDPKDMGKVMKQIMPKIKGRADNQLVSKLVQQQLQK